MNAAYRIFAAALLWTGSWDGKAQENGQSHDLSPGQTHAGQTNQLQLNFHGVSLDTVLDYLSSAAD